MTTTTTAKNITQVLTPKFRVSFPAVFEPKLPPGKTDPKDAKYSITMLFKVEGTDAVDITPLKNAVRDVMVAKFGEDKTKWPKGFKLPFRSGEEEAKKDADGYGKGIIFCSASAKREFKPGLVDQNKKPITSPSEFYGGCYARATLSVYWYDKGVNKGIAFGLRNIQKWHDGEPFSGRTKPENDFDALDVPLADISEKGTTTPATSEEDSLGI